MSTGSKVSGVGLRRGASSQRGRALSPSVRRHVAELPFALVQVSTILGAGILQLAVVIALVGFVPGLVLIAGFAVVFCVAYPHIVDALHAGLEERTDRDVRALAQRGWKKLANVGFTDHDLDQIVPIVVAEQAGRKGPGLLAEGFAHYGRRLGRTGTTTVRVGMIIYIMPALIGYMRGGGDALAIAAMLLTADGVPAALPLAVAGILMAASVVVGRLHFGARGAVASLATMAAAWAAAVAFLMTVPVPPAVPVLLFAASAFITIVRAWGGAGKSSAETAGDQLTTTDAVSAGLTATTVLLIVATIFVAGWLVVTHAGWAHPPLAVWPIGMNHTSQAVGTIWFSYVGVGFYALLKYRHLFLPDESGKPRLRSIVVLGTLIPGVLYLIVVVLVSLSIPAASLLMADRQKQYATTLLAARISVFSGVGSVVAIVGILAALLAVMATTIGFSGALGDNLARTRVSRGREKKLPIFTLLAQSGVLVLATSIAAWASSTQALSLTKLLAVGGGGGVLFILVAPMFLPPRGQSHPPQWRIALATLATILTLAMNLQTAWSVYQSHNQGAVEVAAIVAVIAFAELACFVALLMSEPASTRPAAMTPQLTPALPRP